MNKFSEVSLDRLATAHQKLQRLAHIVLKVFDISIICGHRQKEDQDQAFAEGKSKLQWPKSKHNSFPAMAIDAWPYPVKWPSLDAIPPEHRKAADDYATALASWYYMAGLFKGAGAALDIDINWGGHFKSFFDAPHIELGDSEE
jgi:peptidoglycan L-alanyl-D-glutamate endopeptidase CwlK